MFVNRFEEHDERHLKSMKLFDRLNLMHLYRIMTIDQNQDEQEQFHSIV